VKHKFWTWVLIVFVVFFIAKNPSRAAVTAGNIGDQLASLATSLGDFFTALFGGGR
jgi:hypothetical protein